MVDFTALSVISQAYKPSQLLAFFLSEMNKKS